MFSLHAHILILCSFASCNQRTLPSKKLNLVSDLLLGKFLSRNSTKVKPNKFELATTLDVITIDCIYTGTIQSFYVPGEVNTFTIHAYWSDRWRYLL